ncbi:hypothetical protein [Burkholderia arboris]|uniref:hypothetical protein n=1 Tax=Burkholderia arboris TaxID=488730 RepID=UPI001CF52D28|nr:hypothetical protein [Burkholderia arboris]MCA8050734.1 hypothetical protein [Burkholderia arboris]
MRDAVGATYIAMPRDVSSSVCAFKLKSSSRMNDRMTVQDPINDNIVVDHEIEVSAAGDTVWVTGNDGSCVGRFSKRFGIDVHRTVSEMLAGAEQCLYCTHEPGGQDAWNAFRAAIAQHHGIVVPGHLISFTE